jgi:hypothetical protein
MICSGEIELLDAVDDSTAIEPLTSIGGACLTESSA